MDTPSLDKSNKNSDLLPKDEDASAIYRSGKYYVVVGNTATMMQAIKEHIFYEIDVPKLGQNAPGRFGLHAKFYLEITNFVTSFYLAKTDNVDIIQRVNNQCSSYDHSEGIF